MQSIIALKLDKRPLVMGRNWPGFDVGNADWPETTYCTVHPKVRHLTSEIVVAATVLANGDGAHPFADSPSLNAPLIREGMAVP